MTTKAKPVAKTEKEWWELMRSVLNMWNNSSHPEDNMCLQDYLGNYVGTEIFGFKVEVDSSTQTGYSVTKSLTNI